MQNCLRCNYLFPPKEISDGCCRHCLDSDSAREYQKKLKKEHELKEIQKEKYNSIKLTTEMTIQEGIEQIELISSECVYGKKKNLFASIIDVIV